MPWEYNQTTGVMRKDGIPAGKAYSGHGNGLNNPELEASPDIGPIPCGWWTIQGPPQNTADHGPYVLRLDPDKATLTFGRSGFLIHGDNIEQAGLEEASKGCIVAPRMLRTRIWQSGDTRLLVVSGMVAHDVDSEMCT